MTTGSLAAAVAAYGLLGTTATFPGRPLDDREFDRLLAVCGAHRLTGHLVAAVADGALPLRDEHADRLSREHFQAVCGWLQLEGTLLQAVGTLSSAGIECRVLKGAAVAHLDYADPALRGFGDVDLLVRSADIDAATAALRAAGYHRRVPEPRRGFDRRFGKGATFEAPGGHEVDLHRTFVMGAFGLTVVMPDLWERHDAFELAGRPLTALDPECRLLQACYNAVLGDRTPRLATLRDIAQLLLSDRVDPARVRELARRWRAEAVLAAGIDTAWRTLQLSDALTLTEWARRHRPDSASARIMSTYLASSGYAAKAWAAVWALPRTRDRVAFLASLAFPADGALGGRRRSLLARARSAADGWRSWEGMT